VHIARQQALLAGLRLRNQPTGIAERLLAEFRHTLALQSEHRDAIARAIRARNKGAPGAAICHFAADRLYGWG